MIHTAGKAGVLLPVRQGKPLADKIGAPDWPLARNAVELSPTEKSVWR